MQYNSLACTEFFLEFLGIDSIKQRLSTMGASIDNILYPASGVLALANDENLPYYWWIEGMLLDTQDLFNSKVSSYHQKLKEDATGQYKKLASQFSDPKL